MGRIRETTPTVEVDSRLRDQRRRSLRRKIRLQTAEMVRDTISEEKAVSLGLGNEWRKKVGP